MDEIVKKVTQAPERYAVVLITERGTTIVEAVWVVFIGKHRFLPLGRAVKEVVEYVKGRHPKASSVKFKCWADESRAGMAPLYVNS